MASLDGPSCILCGGPVNVRYEVPRIWHQPKGSRPYTVAWCDACDHGSLIPRPSQADLDNFYGTTLFLSVCGRDGGAVRRPDRFQAGSSYNTRSDASSRGMAVRPRSKARHGRSQGHGWPASAECV